MNTYKNVIITKVKKIVIATLTLIHLDGTARNIKSRYNKRIDIKQKKFKYRKKLEQKQKQICDIIYSISPCPENNIVYIFQCSFFNRSGTEYFSGGGERYACDLSKLISLKKYTVILFQSGIEDSQNPWINHFNGINVIGINGTWQDYYYLCGTMPEPKLAIFSGFTDWINVKYTNSLLISHGITWDVPITDADSDALMRRLAMFRRMVSVDVNTISWFRSTYAKRLKSQKIQFNYIPNYVDTQLFTPKTRNSRTLKITFPRRLCRERGFWLFAPVARKLLTLYDFLEVEFVGYIHDACIARYLKRLTSTFAGRVSHRLVPAEQMQTVYQNTDISVIPTLYAEGTSLSCLEAMACGNCIIATNIGGLANLILPDFNGKLINPDSDELFNALCTVVNDPELRAALGKNARATAMAFSKEVWEKRWMRVLDAYF